MSDILGHSEQKIHRIVLRGGSPANLADIDHSQIEDKSELKKEGGLRKLFRRQ